MMTCPACESAIEITQQVQTLAPCPVCARTLVVSGETARLAVDRDVLALSDHERRSLKAMRPAAWRADQQARLREIRGR